MNRPIEGMHFVLNKKQTVEIRKENIQTGLMELIFWVNKTDRNLLQVVFKKEDLKKANFDIATAAFLNKAVREFRFIPIGCVLLGL